MLNNRVSTAQIAEELLDDFYVRNNHEMLRRKHNKKLQQKLVQPLGGLTPIQSIHLTQSLENFDRIDGAFSSQLRGARGVVGGKGRPLSKSVSFGMNEYQDGGILTLSDTASTLSSSMGATTNSSDRNVKYAPSQGVTGDNQQSGRGATNPLAIDMMHRVTFQSGGSPGKFHQLHSSESEASALTMTQEEEEEDNATIAANAREIQYNAMNESIIMQQILTEILDLNKDVDRARAELEVELPAHRHDLLGRVDVANVTYVRLFERMLAETLLIQRSKFKSQTEAIRELRALLSQLQIAEQGSREKETEARNAAQQMEIETASLLKTIEQLQAQLEEIHLKYAKLEDENKTNLRKVEALKGGLSVAEKNAFAADIRNEERAKFMKELALMKKKWEKEMEARAKEMAKAMQGPAGPSMADLTAAAKQNNDFKRPTAEMHTQTQVDEHGIWDKQDGWFLPVSGTRQARIRWRAALNFASCPQCRGAGHFIGMAAKLLRMMMRGGGNALVDEDKKPKGKTGARWLIPDDLVRFLSNIPRSALAISPRPPAWTLRRLWHHLDKKAKSDHLDEVQGLPVQELQDFLVEAYLMRSEKRSDAELALFTLLQSMQEHHRRSSLVHTYSRFVGVLDGWTVEQMKVKQAEKEEARRRQEQRELDNKYKKMSARERTAHARKLEEDKREKQEREQGKAQEEEKLPLCDASLSLSIMTVYLYARSCLLEPYKGMYSTKMAAIKRNSGHLAGNEAKLRGKDEEKEEWPIHLPAHLCVDRSLSVFLPLDRALRVLTAMISFADEKQYNSALRLLEHSVVLLLPDGEIRLPEGMHTTIRSCVRELMTTDSADGADLTNLEVYLRQQELGKIPPRDPELGPMSEKELEESKDVMLVDMDVLLRIVCECLLYRTRYVEKRLAEIFVEGDDNQDGVLSFSEFMSIVHNVAPHFTDRRALRMYREALSMGNDDDSIGPEAFVSICKRHGLVSLIDLREIREGSLKALSKTEEQKQQEQKNREIALAAKAAALLATPAPLFGSGGFKSPQDRAAARRNSTLQIMSRKGISQGLLAVANVHAQGAGDKAGDGMLGGGGNGSPAGVNNNSPGGSSKPSPLGKALRRGSMMGGSSTPARDLLASLKQAAGGSVNTSAGDDSKPESGGGGSPKAGGAALGMGMGSGKATLLGKLRRASSVGLSSPIKGAGGLLSPGDNPAVGSFNAGGANIPPKPLSMSAKRPADILPGQETQELEQMQHRAEVAALAAAGMGPGSGGGGGEGGCAPTASTSTSTSTSGPSSSRVPVPVPMPVGGSRMFGSPLEGPERGGVPSLREEEEDMSDSDSSGSGSDSSTSLRLRGVIAKSQHGKGKGKGGGGAVQSQVAVPVVVTRNSPSPSPVLTRAPAQAPVPAPVPSLEPSHSSRSRDNLLATFRSEEEEKRKSAQDSSVGVDGASVAAVLRSRAQARLQV